MRRGSPATEAERVLVLDNRDSFVFNLVDEYRSRGASVLTLRSALSLEALEGTLEEFDPQLVVLSPGPGRPEHVGVMVEWLATAPEVPVLGICLGHQALAVAAGGEVSHAPRPVHGQKDRVTLVVDEPLFEGLGPTLTAARYHSLVVTRVPETMRVIATIEQSGDARHGAASPEPLPARAPVSSRVHLDAPGPNASVAVFRGSQT